MLRATRVRRKRPAGGKKKTRRVRKRHLRTRRKNRIPYRKRTRSHRGGTQMGKNLLRLFDPRGGLGALTPLVAGHLTPQDVLNIVKCDPVLWRYRKEILTNLLGMSLGSAELAMQAPIKHAVALCRRITPAEKKKVGMHLFLHANRFNNIEMMKTVFKDFNLTTNDVREIGAALNTAIDAGYTDIVKYLTKPVADGGVGLTADDIRNEWSLNYAIREGHTDIVKHFTKPVADGGVGLTADDARAGDNWALQLAAMYGRTDIVKYLTKPVAEGGMGLTAHDIKNSSALKWAKNYPEIKRHLQDIVSSDMVKWVKDRFGITLNELDE